MIALITIKIDTFTFQLREIGVILVIEEENYMPTISMFYGIIIRMYFAPSEHNPPHFHAYYNEYKASFCLDTFEVTDGKLPRKQIRLVQAWAELHVDELNANWKLVMSGESVYKIEPLA